MALGKQAKIISDKQVRAVLAELDTRRYPLRDRVMLLLSIKAGMRAVEIASITWGMITDADHPLGQAFDGAGNSMPLHTGPDKPTDRTQQGPLVS
jgi:integrase